MLIHDQTAEILTWISLGIAVVAVVFLLLIWTGDDE